MLSRSGLFLAPIEILYHIIYISINNYDYMNEFGIDTSEDYPFILNATYMSIFYTLCAVFIVVRIATSSLCKKSETEETVQEER